MNQIPLWLNPQWWAPRPRQPGNAQRDAEHRWENEGGNPPMGDPPDENPPKDA